MDNIETVAATMSGTVCLGVGLHSGYGTAQDCSIVKYKGR